MPATDADGRQNDHGLAGLDGLGDPAELRARAEEAIAVLDIDPRPGASQEGADASNSVWVTVSPSGAILDVSISRQWTDRLPVERLGEAVLEAYFRAQEKRGASAALAAMRQSDVGGPDDAPAEPYDPGMPDIDDPRWLGWVWQSIDEAGLRADQLLARRPVDTAAERTVAGPNGYVRVQATGPRVTAVLVDAPSVAKRNPDAVAVDARAAFEAVRAGSR
jgi:hypothetical protein